MLLRPGVLFADEPTAALDVSVQKQVLEELLLLRKTYGTAIVLVAHNIGVIGAMADRVLVMQDGRTVEYGETQTVLYDPQASYTRMLLSAVHEHDGKEELHLVMLDDSVPAGAQLC